MESSSEGFLAANRNFSEATRDIESIQAGREATTRGRSEDIIPAYQALRPQGQAAFRAGYVEPLIAQTQGSAPGVITEAPTSFQGYTGTIQTLTDGAFTEIRVPHEQAVLLAVEVDHVVHDAKRTIIATLALATMCSPAFAYSNVSPKEAPQKVTATNQRSVSTFDDVSPFWTINPDKDRYHGGPKSND